MALDETFRVNQRARKSSHFSDTNRTQAHTNRNVELMYFLNSPVVKAENWSEASSEREKETKRERKNNCTQADINRHNNSNYDEWNSAEEFVHLSRWLSLFGSSQSSIVASLSLAASNHSLNMLAAVALRAHYKLLACIAIYEWLCSTCTINYIAWPSIPDTQQSEPQPENESDCIRSPHSRQHYVTDCS